MEGSRKTGAQAFCDSQNFSDAFCFSGAGELVIMKLHLCTQTLTSILEHVYKENLNFESPKHKGGKNKALTVQSFPYICVEI